jgi:hypothetical protein
VIFFLNLHSKHITVLHFFCSGLWVKFSTVFGFITTPPLPALQQQTLSIPCKVNEWWHGMIYHFEKTLKTRKFVMLQNTRHFISLYKKINRNITVPSARESTTNFQTIDFHNFWPYIYTLKWKCETLHNYNAELIGDLLLQYLLNANLFVVIHWNDLKNISCFYIQWWGLPLFIKFCHFVIIKLSY